MKSSYQRLVLCHAITVLLVISFFWEATAPFWNYIDLTLFKILNRTLEGNPLSQYFWAFCNLRTADWIEDIVFILFFVIYVRSFPRNAWKSKICDLCIAIVFCALIITYVNHGIFRKLIHIRHPSPSLIIGGGISVSDILPWTHVKTTSPASFPGDHATTALFFPVILSWLRAPFKLRCAAWCYGIFLCLPRMVVGAHGLSDALIGSLSIVLLSTHWLFCTPLFKISTTLLQRGLSKFTRKPQEIA